ncbi:MAG TPA: hypothetical protein VGW31_10280 [Hanamia sp.]|nr:hypothetical protein [Hanamia sp.]
MKKVIFLFVAFSLFATSFASSGFNALPKNAADVYLPMGNNTQISLMDLSVIKVKDYQKISGKHLNFFERIAFKAGQRNLRKSISEDGTITNKKLLKAIESGDHSTGFHIGGFALGFLLGIIGVLLAYVIGGDEDVKKNRAKWAWIGFGLYVVIVVAILLSIKTPIY